jgi:hypothetical protein
VSALDGHDVVRLLLLETALRHLTDAGVVDERRVLDGVVEHLADELQAARDAQAARRAQLAELLERVRHARANMHDGPRTHGPALEDAYRCLAALRRLELES